MALVWRYVEPGDNMQPVMKEFTESQILEQYGPWWRSEMRRVGKADEISDENCIMEWVVVNWAWDPHV